MWLVPENDLIDEAVRKLLHRVLGAGSYAPRRDRRAQSNPEQSGAFAVSLPVDLLKFALLFSTLYAAFGVASPFLPELLSLHGLNPERLGITLSLATTIRLVSHPSRVA
jgi:hypothetical protein